MLKTIITQTTDITEVRILPTHKPEYEKEIQCAVAFIESHSPDDYNIVSNYLYYKSRYETAVGEGNGMNEPIATLYARKEAYRQIAHARGYTDEVMHSGGR